MNRIMGVIAVLLAFGICIQVYMSMAMNANTTGWQNIMVSSIQQFLPLIALVGVLIFILSAAFVSKKG